GVAAVDESELGKEEVNPTEVSIAEIRTTDVRNHRRVLLAPTIPGVNALLQYLDVLLICHATPPNGFISQLYGALMAAGCELSGGGEGLVE
ncbi:MAG: hypothetical protein AAF902_25120, partial [Chloroflexota bacterium]